jgi:hypothetical protein
MRKLLVFLLLGGGSVALACTLNPQPLPPESAFGDADGGATRADGAANGSSGGAGSDSGKAYGDAAPPPPYQEAGTDAGALDAAPDAPSDAPADAEDSG